MGIYIPNTELPEKGYITLKIHADGSVVKIRECKDGILRVIATPMDDAISMDEQDIKKTA